MGTYKGPSDPISQGDQVPSLHAIPLQEEFKHPSSMSLPSAMGLFNTPFVLLEKVCHITRKLPCLLHHPWGLQLGTTTAGRLASLESPPSSSPSACERQWAAASRAGHSHRMGALIQVCDWPHTSVPGTSHPQRPSQTPDLHTCSQRFSHCP